MNDDHIHAFVSESRESITDLNNALLTLEDDPNDDEAIESVFRTAHTLKGNFGAMGFPNASELAHVLEDLLDEIRDGELGVTAEMMDAAFDGVDSIETIIDEIDETGDSTTDPDETTARLRAAIEGGEAVTSSADSAVTTGDERSGSGEESTAFAHAEEPPTFEDASGLVHGRVGVDPDGMLGVDAMLILEPLSNAVEELVTAPTREAIEEGAYDGEFDVFAPETTPQALTEILDRIGAVETFETRAIEQNTESGGSASDPSPSKKSGGNDISSVRVDVDRLDELHGLVEQLVTGRITIRRAIEDGDFETAEGNLNDFDKVTERLQNTVMDMRLIPLRRVVSNLPRVVRDVARSQDKDVSFEMYGEDIELDRSILTEIEDPLIHILRNAVDHGIESPDERESKGKAQTGEIELRASRQRDHVTVTVSDDGGGIDPDAMRQKATDENVITESEAESMSDDEAYDLVFHPGFSTASEVTDVSGRGVGMDVVHSTVERLDGTVNVESDPGEGTTVTLRLPVSVAIVNVLFVTVGEQEYGIPIKNIDELTHAVDIETISGNPIVRHDDEVYPVIELEEALELDASVDTGETAVAADGGTPEASPTSEAAISGDESMLVRIRKSVRPVALRCDSFSDQEEVVVKPLEGALSGIPGLSGTAILGDGNIVPILDVVSLER